VTRPLPQLHDGRDGPKALIKAHNELRRFAYRAPGVSIAPVGDAVGIAAFKCVSFDTTGNVVLARADGTNYATGVLTAATGVGELATVVSLGPVLNAVVGRVANDPCWVGPDGSLVFAAPGVGNYVQPIAVCTSATDIFVVVSAPVI
jgi:hypothetical protein